MPKNITKSLGSDYAGHGGTDPGAVVNGLYEKNLNLQASLHMANRLRQYGIPVVLTRTSDETLSREERIRRILTAFGNDSNVITVSNHMNAGGGEGAEVIYALRNNNTLARNILDGIGSKGQKMRTVYQRRLPEDPSKDYYYIIRDTGRIQTVLVEYGFIDGPAVEVNRLKNRLPDLVDGAVEGILKYLGISPTPPPPPTIGKYIVQAGDTLYSIARMFSTTVDELRRINNLTSDILSIGQVLTLPSFEEVEYITYTVRAGDSLWRIAQEFGVTVNDIIEFNNLTSDILSIGQVLRIPKPATVPEIPTPPVNSYIVQKGDSLWSIATKFGITVAELRALNPQLTSDVLQIGQILNVPGAKGEIIHTVVLGDTLWSIAKKYNTTVDEIKKLNNLTNNLLTVGQQLRIPR